MAASLNRLDDFTLEETVAKGSFGTVYKAVRKSDARVFALKQVKLRGMKRVDREEAVDEARVLSHLSHPHVTQHHGSFIDRDEQLNILMEYAANGSLHALIRAGPSGQPKPLPESKVWKYIIQALLGLAYIHSRKIIHRDIKSLNLFLDSADNIKIGDLGIARSLGSGSAFARTVVGTPYYLSPELCDDKPYNEKSDVWALGIVLYECCMGCYPFEAQNEGALIRKILRGTFAPISGPYSPALVQLGQQMLSFNPTRRPTAQQLLQLPSVINQARAQGIDMACRNPRPVDPPVYQKTQPDQQQQQQLQRGSSDAQPQPRQKQQQQQQVLSEQVVSEHAVQHPFNMPSAAPAATKYQQQSAQQPLGAPLPAQQPQKHGAGCAKPYPEDVVAIAELQQMVAAAGVGCSARPRLEQLPTAGHYQRPCSAGTVPPFAVAGSSSVGRLNTTSAQEAAAGVWTVKPTPPQFGRKRCTDLMAAGPGLRGGGGVRGGGHAAVPVADDATSYCSTSYQATSYH